MRLGPSVGRVYVLGAEGYSGRNRGYYRLGGAKAYAAAERSETGKSNDLCSSEFEGSEPDRFKNSDLESKCPSLTVYIQGEVEMNLLR